MTGIMFTLRCPPPRAHTHTHTHNKAFKLQHLIIGDPCQFILMLANSLIYMYMYMYSYR